MSNENKTANDLPRLIAEADRDNVRGTIRLMEHQVNDDGVALRLGRAFLQGRLDAFSGNAKAFDPHTPPLYPTRDECNLYAGGYQYDFESHPNEMMEHMIGQEDKRAGQQIEDVEKSMEELRMIGEAIAENGPSLSLLDAKFDCRTHIMMATINNLIERQNFNDMRTSLHSRANADETPSLHEVLTKLFGDAVRRPPAR